MADALVDTWVYAAVYAFTNGTNTGSSYSGFRLTDSYGDFPMFKRIILMVAFLAVCSVSPAKSQESVDSGKRIQWRTSTLDAFVEAVENTKPLVFVVLANPASRDKTGDNPSNAQWSELDELSVHAHAQDAVFCVVTYDQRLGRFKMSFLCVSSRT